MKRLYRERWDRKLAGVCGGLGCFLGIDPTVLRLLVILICIFTGVLPMLVVYILAWILVPLGPSTYIEFKCKRLYRSHKSRKIAGICGGIAEALNMDPTLIRLLVLFAFVITGIVPVLITYLVGTLIIPERQRHEPSK